MAVCPDINGVARRAHRHDRVVGKRVAERVFVEMTQQALPVAYYVCPVAVCAYPYVAERVFKSSVYGLVGQEHPFVGLSSEVGECQFARRQRITRVGDADTPVFGGNPYASVACLVYMVYVV